MDADLDRLRALLGGPGAAWLLERVRARMERGEAGPMSGWVQLREPTPDQRLSAMRLVGAPRRAGQTLRVDLEAVEDVLRRGVWPAGLADAVVALTGPVANRSSERSAEAAAWARAASAFAPAAQVHPGLGRWWERWCAAGGLKRVARAELARIGGDISTLPATGERLAAEAAATLCALPAAGEPLAVFARATTGDAHGLDPSRPLDRVVLAALPGMAGRESGHGHAHVSDHVPAPDDSVGPRELWAKLGVLMSAVSSTVLCLGVPAADPGRDGVSTRSAATAAALDAWRTTGMPVVLTLDQVTSGGVGVVTPGGVVHVCENPSVVEVAAGRWTAPEMGESPVLVCTSGQPGAAVIDLLTCLTSAGAAVRYHGDFDWAGLRIAASLAERVPWRPWRFEAVDYEEAVTAAGATRPARADRELLALRGTPAPSPWDPALAVAMAARGVAVEEEEVVDLLVGDLLR